MVFLTVGSTSNDFKRLLKEVDQLVSKGVLNEVFAQVGRTTYKPINYQYESFLSERDIDFYMKNASIIICHAGTGTLDRCLGLKKKVVVVPRLKIFNEHPDDHQLELANYLQTINRVLVVKEIEKLRDVLISVDTWKPDFKSNTEKSQILLTIEQYILDSFH